MNHKDTKPQRESLSWCLCVLAVGHFLLELLALHAVFDENGAAAFRRDRSDGRTRKLQRQNEALRAKLAKKDGVIAELLSEHVALKKVLGRLESDLGRP